MMHMHSLRCRSRLVSEDKVVDRLVGMHQGQFALRLSTLQAAMGLGGLVPGIGFGDIGINAPLAINGTRLATPRFQMSGC